ncbi:transglutaminase-like domain-containing protein [Microbacterium yannicii]|uniref:transglutaminase-like domain-containing protein n=1 Tax=Microbacterium yannicii TaxID=671622 RepID=UPI0002F0077E|nr:transglutaminase-like domain-containing protein [Microbacterium yannicii]
MQRDVSSRIVLDITEPADLIFAIAAADQYEPSQEIFTATLDGTSLDWHVVSDAHGTRLHRVSTGTGRLIAEYSATVTGQAQPLPATESDLLVYTRPSRYAESDALGPTAWAEFQGINDPAELLASVSSWVGTRLQYVSGSSLPTDGATRTLLARQGVCRDYVHLSVALLRGLNIPARMTSAYAPGLTPMDFHAVAEAWIGDAWRVVDATTLAPRSTLVRIATGRDAADTAFLTVASGRADLVELTVTATADALPDDDITQLVSLT